MEETYPKLFDCPDYVQGKYCHALCNYRHQTEEEKQASRFWLDSSCCSVEIRFIYSLVERYRESFSMRLHSKQSKRFGPVRVI